MHQIFTKLRGGAVEEETAHVRPSNDGTFDRHDGCPEERPKSVFRKSSREWLSERGGRKVLGTLGCGLETNGRYSSPRSEEASRPKVIWQRSGLVSVLVSGDYVVSSVA